MYKLHCSKNSICFFQIVKFFQLHLLGLGYEAVLSELPPTNTVEPGVTWIIWWPNVPYIPANSIVVNMNPLTPKVLSAFEQGITVFEDKSSTKIIEYTSPTSKNSDYWKNVSGMKLMGTLYWGYSHFYDNYVVSDCPTQDIDILYFGGMNTRRTQILEKVQTFCSIFGLNLVIRSDLYNVFEKTDLIKRSKIVLSIASSEAKSMATNDLARLGMVISLGAFVISERVGDEVVENALNIIKSHLFSLED
eukprot:Awhi_evm2s12450